MGWPCKVCSTSVTTRSDIVKHYRLHHGTFGPYHALPCVYVDCPCSFKSWNALHSHLSRNHVEVESLPQEVIISFTCQLCQGSVFSSEKTYFEHIGHHLKHNETIDCVFAGCNHQTNVYGTFQTHKHSKHTPHTLHDFKPGILSQEHCREELNAEDENDVSDDNNALTNSDVPFEEESNVLIEHIAALLLKLESVHNVSLKCIDELVEELHFISNSASKAALKEIIVSHFQRNNHSVNDGFVNSLVEELCTSNPLSTALSAGGPLSSSFRRRQYFKETFDVVEPVEYILESNEKRSFQYVPILQSLNQILKSDHLREKDLSTEQNHSSSTTYGSYQDSTLYKEN